MGWEFLFLFKQGNSSYTIRYGALLIVTFANLLADGLSMAIGDYLRYVAKLLLQFFFFSLILFQSSMAEDDHRSSERKRELWEIEHVPEKEKQEMVDIYVAKGVTQEDAQRVVELLWPHREAYLGYEFSSCVSLTSTN